MSFKDIIISKTSLFVLIIMLLLIVINAIMMYFIRRKQNQKVIDSKEFKKISSDFDKLKMKGIKVIAKKTTKKGNDDDLIPYTLLKKKSKFSYAYWKEYFLDKYSAGSIILINMELTNGFHRTFLIKEQEGGFQFKGNKYIFDDECKYYNIDTKLYMFDYHEGVVLPIKRKIPVTAIKKTLESTPDIDIEYAINPSTLQRFMTAKIAEGVMKGTQLDEFFRKLQMFLIVTMVSTLVHLALFLYGSGMLSNIRIPGIG